MRIALALAALGVLTLAACETTAAQSTGPVMITLERTPCFGFCPDYTVSIDGDGNVIYNGRRFVGVTGERHGRASRTDVQALLRAFDAVQFEALQDQYRARVSDLPSTIVTLTRDGHTKRVLDYGGTGVGMPAAVRDLQAHIDRVANDAQWVRRAEQPTPKKIAV